MGIGGSGSNTGLFRSLISCGVWGVMTVPAEPFPKDLPPLQELLKITIIIIAAIHTHIGINLG